MNSKTHKKRILITDCDTQAALACVRELGRAGYEVFGMGQSSESASAASRYMADYQTTPNVWDTPFQAWSQTCSWAKKIRCSAILPVSEATIASSLRWRNLIPQELTLLRANEAVLQFSLSKIQFFMRAQRLGLPVAPGRIVKSRSQENIFTDEDFPLIVRTDNRWGKNDRYHKGRSWIIHSRMEWQALRDELHQLDIDLLVQRYVDGQGCGAFLRMESGRRVLWHTHQRLAEIPWQGGVSARRRLNFDESLLQFAENFLSGLNLNGIAMIEFRRAHIETADEQKQGRIYLVELNARPWGSLSLAGHAGIPFITHWTQSLEHSSRPQQQRLIASQDIQPFRKSNIVCTNLYPGEIQHLLSVGKSFKRAELSLSQALGFLGRSLLTLLNIRTRYDFFVWDDPAPCLLQWKKSFSFLHARMNRFANDIFSATRFRLQVMVHQSLNRKTSKADLLSASKILVVCYGNRCRSAFVEAYFKKETLNRRNFYFSRGIHVDDPHIPSRFHKYFINNGLNPLDHTARQLGRDDLDHADVLIFMEKKHLLEVVKKFGFKSLKKYLLLDDRLFGGQGKDIPDPYVQEPLAARQIFEILNQRCRQWADFLS